MPEQISISTDFITLDAFLKWAGVADTGGTPRPLLRLA
jgi:ribosome-associated protein YbcJ (S4-like RNA binding protein)